MQAAQIIRRLRQGDMPTAAELQWFAIGLADGSVSDAQAGAFAMAACLNEFTAQAAADLTLAMRDSGQVMVWDVDGPIWDKHSTGGVGDCVSLVLAPVLAACDIYVPMISGRGLGHTGGTLDKLEAIPGVTTSLDNARMHTILADAGCVIAGASVDLAPADRRLYAIRDVTGTVDNVALITASILSKKLAAGLGGLVLDVKCGSGAFMKTRNDARALAQSLVDVANLAGCKTSALITRMDGPLAPAAGNAIEVAQTMAVLCQGAENDLRDCAIALGAELLMTQAGMSQAQAIKKLTQAIEDGTAADRFSKMIYSMGGPINFAENWMRFLPEASVIQEVPSPQSGFVSGWNGQAIGECVVNLGGGRRIETDTIDPAVGIDQVACVGEWVEKGQPIARIHAARLEPAEQAKTTLQKAVKIGPSKDAQAWPLVLERVS